MTLFRDLENINKLVEDPPEIKEGKYKKHTRTELLLGS